MAYKRLRSLFFKGYQQNELKKGTLQKMPTFRVKKRDLHADAHRFLSQYAAKKNEMQFFKSKCKKKIASAIFLLQK